ncbi:hypothetical protein ECG_09321 [Echinococcus granulosus]|nr:hypothetical protein ECG_09321 [Echinococcus granulosus]
MYLWKTNAFQTEEGELWSQSTASPCYPTPYRVVPCCAVTCAAVPFEHPHWLSRLDQLVSLSPPVIAPSVINTTKLMGMSALLSVLVAVFNTILPPPPPLSSTLQIIPFLLSFLKWEEWNNNGTLIVGSCHGGNGITTVCPQHDTSTSTSTCITDLAVSFTGETDDLRHPQIVFKGQTIRLLPST